MKEKQSLYLQIRMEMKHVSLSMISMLMAVLFRGFITATSQLKILQEPALIMLLTRRRIYGLVLKIQFLRSMITSLKISLQKSLKRNIKRNLMLQELSISTH